MRDRTFGRSGTNTSIECRKKGEKEGEEEREAPHYTFFGFKNGNGAANGPNGARCLLLRLGSVPYVQLLIASG